MTTAPITDRLLKLLIFMQGLTLTAGMRLALEVLDVGGLSVTKLLMFRFDSSETSHLKTVFLSEGGDIFQGASRAVPCCWRLYRSGYATSRHPQESLNGNGARQDAYSFPEN